jgi:hypothetical protein
MPFWTFLILLMLCISGCSAPLDSADKPEGVNTVMLSADVVTLHPLSINGAKPPDGALESAADRIRPFLHGTLRIDDTAAHNAPSPLPASAIFRSSKFKPSLADVTLVYVPNAPDIGRALYTRLENQHQQIVLNAAGIHAMTSPFLTDRDAWVLVLTHEMGHVLGVPANAAHTWQNGHCTDPHCVMYPRTDARAVLAAIFSFGIPNGFCEKCRAELTAGREGTKSAKPLLSNR